ncbi:MAG: hypothetical protein AAGI63_06535 [Planctomycetota bacterium]
MNEEQTNPYAPPSAPTPVRMADAQVVKGKRTILGFILASIGVAGYCFFTWILLASNGPDRKAGLLFLSNVPTYLLWLILLIRGHRVAAVFGFTTVVAQALITGSMLTIGIGSTDQVLRINGAIMVIQAALSAVVFVLARRTGRTASAP